MVGSGLKKVALLADYSYELTHPMLDRLLRRGNLSRDYFYFGVASEPNPVQTLQEKGVKVVVPLGEKALQQTLGESGIERWRGRIAPHQHLPDVWVMPAFAPSKLMSRKGDATASEMRHPPRFHGIWMKDLQKALAVAQGGFSRKGVNYLEDPPAERFAQFADEYFAALLADPETMLSTDIETPFKLKESDEEELEEKENLLDGIILRVSFCFKPGYAVSVPWSPTYLPTIIRLLQSRGILCVWNGATFDVPVIQAAGYEVLGLVFDFMDAYHLLESDLPKGLEWVSSEATDLLPWKHLASVRPAYYSAIDADAALQNALYIKAKLIERGQWELFKNHVVRLMPLLAAAGKRGNLMDLAKREEIRTELLQMKQELILEAQQYVDKQLHPRTLYKTQPDDVAEDFPLSFEPRQLSVVGRWDVIYERSTEKVCSVCGRFASNKTEHFKGSLGPPHEKTGKPTRVKNPCKEQGAVIAPQGAFAPMFYRVEDFNPNSSDQMKAYMRFHGHPIGKDKRDSSKETADASHLKVLIKKYGKKFPLYALTLQLHKAIKTIGTYTPEPDPDGYLHTQYVNSTSTWRFGARKVKFGTQIQNWGSRYDPETGEGNPYAKGARKQIIARPRHTLVQIDSSSVEAVMQGYYMNDPLYMELASKSIHAWLACRALGLEFNPDNVAKVKKDHKPLYNKMKVTNYLTNFGGGDYLLWQTYPDDFPRREDATSTQQALYNLLPTLKAYHHSVRWEAHTKTFLTTPWGYRHSYYDVFKSNPDGTLGFGKDAKRCVAMKPQNSNGAFQKDNLLLIGASPIEGEPLTDIYSVTANWDEHQKHIDAGETWARFMPTNVSVHDSCCLDTETTLVDRCAEMQLAVFTRPIPQMHGLRVGAEVEAGRSWGELEPLAKKVIGSYTMAETEAGMARLAA